jgi:hypothetical protein
MDRPLTRKETLTWFPGRTVRNGAASGCSVQVAPLWVTVIPEASEIDIAERGKVTTRVHPLLEAVPELVIVTDTRYPPRDASLGGIA